MLLIKTCPRHQKPVGCVPCCCENLIQISGPTLRARTAFVSPSEQLTSCLRSLAGFVDNMVDSDVLAHLHLGLIKLKIKHPK